MIEHILILLPTVLAITSLLLFNKRTRWFCYSLAVLGIVSELIPQTINVTALVATSSVLIALMIADVAQHMNVSKPHFVGK